MSNTNENITLSLRAHQEKTVNILYNKISAGEHKVSVSLSSGTGKSAVILELSKQLLSSRTISHVLVLTDRTVEIEQLFQLFQSAQFRISKHIDPTALSDVVILTYNTFVKHPIDANKFDLIICNNAVITKRESLKKCFAETSSQFVGIFQNPNEALPNTWFADVKISFIYSIEDSIRDGYLSVRTEPRIYGFAVEGLIGRLLAKIGFKVVMEPDLDQSIHPDILATFGDNQCIFEVKSYRNKFAPISAIDNAVKQLVRYRDALDDAQSSRNTRFNYYLIIFSEVSEEYQKQTLEQFDIVILDLANLLFLCKDAPELYSEINEILYYPTASIIPKAPIGLDFLQSVEKSEIASSNIIDKISQLIKDLHDIKAGKKDNVSAKYENKCTEIIKFLFEGEFTQSSDQHKTGDDLFKMDFLCGIKGSTAFWELLIRHYNTRFVVFEFKNYADKLKQNLIYITEKYLFNAALRNVAIIISRKGFSSNANVAAIGCLKESGKLIIDLTDEDLIEMLHRKADGLEPSDYMLSKLECLLMSVSK